MQRFHLGLRRDHPPQGKHNPLQKAAYTGIVAVGAVATLSGFAIYRPVQLAGLTAVFGGYELARYWHFLNGVDLRRLHPVPPRSRAGGRSGVVARDDHGLVPREVSEP
ncbi:MAG: cytochrome b/b6 domain-containing protein [Gemmatimonadales bacterium]|nr:cytochrome b/b6 domain-containing protein [Gemmatimonadales bacterium]